MPIAKSMIRSALSTFDLSLQKIKHEPYEELWNVPRFNAHTIKLLDRPFTIADSRSFFFSYREIFVDEIYRFNSDSTSPRIIDCGSNYGTSIVYFKHIYPMARLTGIEADPGIFQILKSNCSHLDVELIHKAVSDSREPLIFYVEGSDGGRTAHKIDGAKGTIQVGAITIDDLIDGPVDFLKIDIEGSETKAIDACTKLPLVDQIFIEYHCFQDSEQALDRLLRKLSAHGYRYYIRHQFCSEAPLTKPTSQLGMDLQLNIFAMKNPSIRKVFG